MLAQKKELVYGKLGCVITVFGNMTQSKETLGPS